MKIYEPAGRAREYSPLALNYFKGCTHNCAYCYVNRLNAAFGTGLTQDKCAGPTEAGFVELERSAKKCRVAINKFCYRLPVIRMQTWHRKQPAGYWKF